MTTTDDAPAAATPDPRIPSYEDAIAALRGFVAHSPGSAEGWHRLAGLLHRTGDLPQAIDAAAAAAVGEVNSRFTPSVVAALLSAYWLFCACTAFCSAMPAAASTR